jgi:hypothetical protein
LTTRAPAGETGGPDIQFPSDVAVPFGMAVHELTTNAAKFGALSRSKGRVEVNWEIRSEGGAETLRLEWIEQDGPPVEEPTYEGLGSKLLKRVLTTQVGARVGNRVSSGGASVRRSRCRWRHSQVQPAPRTDLPAHHRNQADTVVSCRLLLACLSMRPACPSPAAVLQSGGRFVWASREP